MFFVSLHPVMKKLVMKYVSAVMALWYLVGIMGFDVHSCTATGDVFVQPVLAGVTCDDIHPEHDCGDHGSCCGHDRSCCHSHGQKSETALSEDSSLECCTNEIETLDVSGVQSARSFHDDDKCDCGYCPCVEPVVSAQVYLSASAVFYKIPDSWVAVPERQALLNIWRI